MKNKTVIRTKHVCIQEEQVFLKKEVQQVLEGETEVPEWFPTDFNWVSAQL